MHPPIGPGALSGDARLKSSLSACLSRIHRAYKSRTERPRKTKIGTKVAHVTRDSDTTFKVKRSKIKVTRPLWLAVQSLHHLDDTIFYTSARASRCLSTLGWGIVWRPPAQLVLFILGCYKFSFGALFLLFMYLPLLYIYCDVAMFYERIN